MPPRPTRAATKKVDYSKFQDPDAPQDDGDFDDGDVTMEDFHEDEDEDEDDDDGYHEVEEDDASEGENQEVAKTFTEFDADSMMVEDDPSSTKNKKKREYKKKERVPKAKKEPATRGRKPKLTVPKPPKVPGVKTEVLAIKNLTNYKDKMNRMFGYNIDKLIELIEYKKHWEHDMFTAPVQKCNDVDPIEELPSSLEENRTQFIPIDQEKLYDAFKVITESDTKQVQFDTTEGTIQLSTGESKTNTDGRIILNAGFHVTGMLWFPADYSDDMLLLVAISDDISKFEPIPSTFFKRETYSAGFQLYKLSKFTNELKLQRTILHHFGNSWDLKLIKVSNSQVLISGMFNDATVKFLHLPIGETTVPEYQEITSSQPRLEIKLKEELITAYDIYSNFTKVVIGTNTGNVLFFDLNVSTTIPIKVHTVLNCHIFSLAAGESKYDETIIYGTSANGWTFALNTTHLETSVNRISRSKGISLVTKFNKALYSFVQLDGQYPAKMFPARGLFLTYPISNHNGSIECIDMSPHHPQMLSGGSDGAVKVASMVRRILCGPKGNNYHRTVTLWEYQYHKKMNVYRVLRTFDTEKIASLDNANNLPLYNKECGVSALAWAQGRKDAADWFAASTVTGLIVLDRVV